MTSRSSLVAAACAAALFCAIAAVLLTRGLEHERSAFDQNVFHLRVVERFAGQWPRLDVRDYESATTPGYHVVLAGVKVLTGWGVDGLRVCGAAFTVALLGALAWWTARRVGAGTAVALALPMLCSMYVLFAGVWLLPDNAGWLGVALVLMLALRDDRPRWWAAAGGAILLALVLVRQVHAWAAAPLVMAAYLGPALLATGGSMAPEGPLGLVPSLDPRRIGWWRGALVRVAWCAAWCLPAAAALGWFVWRWGGLTPPAFQPGGSRLTTREFTNVSGISPATPALVLALVGIFGTFFAGYVWPVLARGRIGWRAWVVPALIGAALALALSLAADTSYSFRPPRNPDMSRMSGLWNAVKWFEDQSGQVWTRSPAVIVPAVLGGAWLGLWWSALDRRGAWVLGAALLAFTAAHTAGALSWQRYLEPMVLMLLILAAARAAVRLPPARWAWAGPVILAAGQAALAYAQLR